ncbi:MAG: hypothetical protein CMC99_02295 [Flavobacteriales bacterium]|nr:hypothetical protein [Flavobacteriales bacterium]
MSLLTIVLTAVLCGALGMWCGQCWTSPRPERLSATPPDAWMERHQRLRDQSKLAQRRHDLRHTRNEVQQQTLQLHLSPHFMFNALSSVQWLWSEHKRDRAAQLFSNFVTLWRHHWRSQEASTHTLQEELTSLQAYSTLEAQRLGRAVALEVRVDPSVSRDGRLPALLLQPAMENALWHGLDASVLHPRLELAISPQKGRANWVTIVLRDNGVGLSRSSSTTSTDAPSDHVSMGTEITSMRLREVHPEARFDLREARAPWSTEVVISLPLVAPNS